MGLSDAFKVAQQIFQKPLIGPQMSTVEKTEYKEHAHVNFIQLFPHNTMDILTAPVYGSTKPNDFISIQGVIPKTPTVIQVPVVMGSNAPQGGSLYD